MGLLKRVVCSAAFLGNQTWVRKSTGTISGASKEAGMTVWVTRNSARGNCKVIPEQVLDDSTRN